MMEPRPHTPILPQNSFRLIELSGPPSHQDINPLRLEINSLFYCSSGKYKQPVAKNWNRVGE